MRIHPNVYPDLAGGLGASPTGIFKDTDIRVHACIPAFMRCASLKPRHFASHLLLRTVRTFAFSRCVARIIQRLNPDGEGNVIARFQTHTHGGFYE